MATLRGFDRKLTGGAKAASMIASIPISGFCRRFMTRRTKKANRERHGGSSRMMPVSTTPGSAALVVWNVRLQISEGTDFK
jgi:hypothetical protein